MRAASQLFSADGAHSEPAQRAPQAGAHETPTAHADGCASETGSRKQDVPASLGVAGILAMLSSSRGSARVRRLELLQLKLRRRRDFHRRLQPRLGSGFYRLKEPDKYTVVCSNQVPPS